MAHVLVPRKCLSKQRRCKQRLTVPLVLLLGGAAGAGYFADDFSLGDAAAVLPGSGCNIKDNISIDSGERIYHVPGQRYYNATGIYHSKVSTGSVPSKKPVRQDGAKRASDHTASRRI